MSWDVIIFNFKGNPPDFNNLPNDFMPPNIGDKAYIREKINQVFHNTDWSDKNWGVYDGKGFSIEFSLSAEEPLNSFTLLVRGNGNPLPGIVKLCNMNTWSAFDTGTGEFIDLDNPTNEGWDNFRKYRDDILKKGVWDMAFSEKLKQKIREKSAFRCCRCQNIGIDIHHIIPQKDGGTDDEDNAAPLCQNCHNQFGDNPQKRKEIKQMRDWWCKVCAKKYFKEDDPSILNEINNKLESIQTKQSQDVSELKIILKDFVNNYIEGITPSTAGTIASSIVNASTSTKAVQLGEKVYGNFHCSKCNYSIGLLIGTNKCPKCGSIINYR